MIHTSLWTKSHIPSLIALWQGSHAAFGIRIRMAVTPVQPEEHQSLSAGCFDVIPKQRAAPPLARGSNREEWKLRWSAIITVRWSNEIITKMAFLTTTMEASAHVREGTELVRFTNTLAQGLNRAGS